MLTEEDYKEDMLAFTYFDIIDWVLIHAVYKDNGEVVFKSMKNVEQFSSDLMKSYDMKFKGDYY